ncbi:hypothetical protein [Gardnerella vaginalis]|uniref:hypothetical protein n=1 Tax=Gardnerella vaginalis TaxID=2702 RepID=UPI0039708098
MLDGIISVFKAYAAADAIADVAADTTLMELIVEYRNALDQEENALNKVKEARDKCQALQEAKQALNVAQQKYYNAIQELNKQQDKFDENNAEVISAFLEAKQASNDAKTRLFDEIRR